MLIQSLWLSHRVRPLTIFLPGELSKPLLQWLNAIYLGPDFLPFELIFVAWETEEFFEVCGLQIRPRETTHLRSLSEKFGNEPVQIVQSPSRAFGIADRIFGRSRQPNGLGGSARHACGSFGQRTRAFSTERSLSVSGYQKNREAFTHASGAGAPRHRGIDRAGSCKFFA